MAQNMDKIITIGLIIMAAVAAYAVLSGNNLFIG